MPQIDLKQFSVPMYDKNEVRRLFLSNIIVDQPSTWTSIEKTPGGQTHLLTSSWILDYIYGNTGKLMHTIDQLIIEHRICVVWFPTLADLVMVELNLLPLWSLVKSLVQVPAYTDMPIYERIIQNIPIIAVPGHDDDYAIYVGKDTGADFIYEQGDLFVDGWTPGSIIETGLKLPAEYRFLAADAHHIGDWGGHYVFNSFSKLTYRR